MIVHYIVQFYLSLYHIIFTFVLFSKKIFLTRLQNINFVYFITVLLTMMSTHQNVQIKKNVINHHLHFPNCWLSTEIHYAFHLLIELVETNPLMHNIKHLRQKQSHYSFEDRGTDGRNRFLNLLSETFQMIYEMPIKP